jgi:hypothetical protein
MGQISGWRRQVVLRFTSFGLQMAVLLSIPPNVCLWQTKAHWLAVKKQRFFHPRSLLIDAKVNSAAVLAKPLFSAQNSLKLNATWGVSDGGTAGAAMVFCHRPRGSAGQRVFGETKQLIKRFFLLSRWLPQRIPLTNSIGFLWCVHACFACCRSFNVCCGDCCHGENQPDR